MLFLNRHHVFLRGRSGNEQAKLLRLRHQFPLFRQRPFDLLAGRRPAQHFVHQLLDRRHQRQLPAHRPLQQESRDNQPVDLVRALENTVDARVAIRPFRRILFHKAIPGKNLQRLVDHVIDHLRAPHFQNRALDRILLDRFAPFLCRVRARRFNFRQQRVHHPHRAIDQRFADINQRRHVRNFFPHQSEIADRLAERLALLGIGHGALD